MSIETKKENALAALSELSTALGPQVLYPSAPEFTSESKVYWSVVNQEIQPLGIITPASAQDVSKAVSVLVSTGSSFSIRSGGHMCTLESNTAENGILISLSKLRHFQIRGKDGIVEVGSGYRWGEVYERLKPHNLTAVGGRYSDVGVAGFLLGGGISQLSNKYGFGADNVENFEVVLASGEIVNANATTNSDLFLALKGGSNNFGVVTRFDIKTTKEEKIWGGNHMVSEEHIPRILKGLNEWQNNGQLDRNAAIVPSIIAGSTLGHNKPMLLITVCYGGAVEKPEALRLIWETPSIHSTLRLTTHGELAAEVAACNSNNERHQFFTGSIKSSDRTAQLLYDIFFKEAERQKLFPKIRMAALTLQPISKSMVTLGQGSNAFVPDPSRTPAIWYVLHTEYDDANFDKDITSISRHIHQEIQIEAKGAGLADEFLFLNDAGEGQNVLQSYGKEKFEKLLEISKIYDPNKVFQKLVRGGYKCA